MRDQAGGMHGAVHTGGYLCAYTSLAGIADVYDPLNKLRLFAGDMTKDAQVNLGDLVFLVNYLYKSGIAPDPIELGDVNCDKAVDLGDVVYLIDYLYKEGPPPCS